jgi:hypothetical protein
MKWTVAPGLIQPLSWYEFGMLIGLIAILILAGWVIIKFCRIVFEASDIE